ncbi:UPF0721 transmembrane protein [Paenibacillus sp. J31TS4]|uniref:sulfite exporter TauE/SafE family protein n=1 Tax=Paenibacillus sp. J31TS4 TaxID=2807195 RepID=UPI001B213C2B|nr:sulfite exporter TauE/SafE family protein [Paenibacillus sp. J31TS4]GIP40220.1 UPF0721 transmembrane protein [Paenibacillus sp. J31TS4]
MENWLLLTGIVFFAALLQASTGFGFSIIGTPFLFLLYPAHAAIQINILLSLCLSLIMIYPVRREIEKGLLGRLAAGSIVGLIPGIGIYLYVEVEWLKAVVGGLILLLTVLLMVNVTIRRTKGRDLLTGGISGALTTSIGVPGPPLLLYFAGAGTAKETLRGTTLAYYLLVYSVSLGLQISLGGTGQEVWVSSGIALPALILGILAGQWLFKRMSQRLFKRMTYVILLFTGTYLLVTSV